MDGGVAESPGLVVGFSDMAAAIAGGVSVVLMFECSLLICVLGMG